MEDLDDLLRDTVAGPSQVATDGVAVTAQDPSKIIEVDQYLSAKEGSGKKGRGLRFSRLVPPGAV